MVASRVSELKVVEFGAEKLKSLREDEVSDETFSFLNYFFFPYQLYDLALIVKMMDSQGHEAMMMEYVRPEFLIA